jgi:hypothetical protein
MSRNHLEALFFRPIAALNPALLSWKMLVSMSLFAMLGTSQRSAFVPRINTVFLFGAPMLQTWWVKISVYF